jgi:hypothetical protein
MSRIFVGVIALLFVCCLVAADGLAGKYKRRVDEIEGDYRDDLKKAERSRLYAIEKAQKDRIRSLKLSLEDATKSNDTKSATALKAILAVAEAEVGINVVAPKPKELIKLGTHSYGLFDEKLTWHVAKKRCEDMGGHLVTLESPAEEEFIQNFCRERKINSWIGLANELDIKKWVWVTGEEAKMQPHWLINDTYKDKQSAALAYWYEYGAYTDYSLGEHESFICEWDT